MREPDINWHWCEDDATACLALSLGEGQTLVTSLTVTEVFIPPAQAGGFTLEQMEDFHHFSRWLSLTSLTGPCLLEATIRAVAAKHFARPKAPKSWFFRRQQGTIGQPRGLVELQSEQQQATLLVIDASDDAATLMLLDDAFVLNPGKALKQFALIRVMNDRLIGRERMEQQFKKLA